MEQLKNESETELQNQSEIEMQNQSEAEMRDEKYMKEALKQAKKAYALEETPIGCVIVHEGKIIARAHYFWAHFLYFIYSQLHPVPAVTFGPAADGSDAD